ncbi:hypothetical protein ACFQX6_34105 [Streptosporangium lutulentum]
MFAATGETAFAGGSIAVVLNRILNHEVDVSVMPEPLRGVVRSALSKSPATRPSADQILLRMLGHPETVNASPMILNQGAQVADPEEDDATSPMRIPSVRLGVPIPGTRPGGAVPTGPVPPATDPSSRHPGHDAPTRDDRRERPGHGERPSSPGHPSPGHPSFPGYGERPSSPGYGERPSSPGYGERPADVPPGWQDVATATWVGDPGPLPARRSRKGRWIAAVAAAAVLLIGGAATLVATGWPPLFGAEEVQPTGSPSRGRSPPWWTRRPRPAGSPSACVTSCPVSR